MKILSIINVSADSFYQKDSSQPDLIKRIEQAFDSGSEYIDVGVESSNPDGRDVAVSEQIERLESFYSAFQTVVDGRKNEQHSTNAGNGLAGGSAKGSAASDAKDGAYDSIVTVPKISIDSYRYEIIEYGLRLGVELINDISGLADPRILDLAMEFDVPVISMFNLRASNPRALAGTGQEFKRGILATVASGLAAIQAKAVNKKFPAERLILDPGMGFFLGSDPGLSFEIMRNLASLRSLGHPLCVSVSHKSFLNIGLAPSQRGHETLLAEYELLQAGTEYIRTHDPASLRRSEAFFKRMTGATGGDLILEE